MASSGKGRTGGRTASAKRAIVSASRRSVFASRPVAREGAHPAGIDDRDRQPGRGQGRRGGDLHPAGGLEHDERGGARDEAGDQGRDLLLIVVDHEALA